MAEVSARDLPDPTSWVTLGWVVAAIFGLVGLMNQGMDLWKKFFPSEHPPAGEKYATKEELRAAVARIAADHETEIDRLEDDMDEDLTRIEHRFEEWIKQLEHNHLTELKGMAVIHRDMKDWQLTIERALGHVEEKAKKS